VSCALHRYTTGAPVITCRCQKQRRIRRVARYALPAAHAEEFATVQVEVSLLTTPQPLGFAGEADALAQLRPGIDGVVFEYGHY